MDIKDKKEKKKLSKSTVIIIGIALTIVIICAALYLFLIYPQTYVGKIGNEIISTKEYKFMLVSRKASMLQMVGLQPGQDPQSEAAFWETDLGGSKAIDIVKKGALEDIKKIKVQAIKAKEAGLKLTSDDLKGLDNYLSSLAAQYENGKIGLEDELKNAYDMTVTQFKNLYKDIILGSKIQSKLQGEYEIFDSDIEKTYNENKKELDIATVRHILVTV